jgi:acylphosphatase
MEKRKLQRVTFHTEAKVTGKDTAIHGRVENLSMKGMFLNTNEKLANDELLEITILLTGASSQLSIELKGSVARQTDSGVAIVFREMDLDSFIHLKNVIAHNSANADEMLDEYYRSVKSEREF